MGARARRVWRESTRSARAPTPALRAGAGNIQPPSVRLQTCVRRALPTLMRSKGATSLRTASAMRATREAMGARAPRVWRESTRSARAPTPASTAGAGNIPPSSVRHQTCVRRVLPTLMHLKAATDKPTVSVMRATRGAMGARARRVWRESSKRQRGLAVAVTVGVVNIRLPWVLRETGLVWCVRLARLHLEEAQH